MAVSDTCHGGFVSCQSAVMKWAIELEVTAFWHITSQTNKQTNKLRGLSPQANYTDRTAAAGRRS